MNPLINIAETSKSIILVIDIDNVEFYELQEIIKEKSIEIFKELAIKDPRVFNKNLAVTNYVGMNSDSKDVQSFPLIRVSI